MVVHLDNCRNISEIRHNPEKCIQLSWAKDVTGEFNVELRVELEHQRGLIALARVIKKLRALTGVIRITRMRA